MKKNGTKKKKAYIDECGDCRKRTRIVDTYKGLCAKCKEIENKQIRAAKKAVAAINAAIAVGIPFVAEDTDGGVIDEYTAAELRVGRKLTPRLVHADVEWLEGRVRLQTQAGFERDRAREEAKKKSA